MIRTVAVDKFSATVDAALLADVRAHAGPRGVSAFVGQALRHELDRVRLRELLVELADELGPPDEDMVDEALDAVRGIVAASHGRSAGDPGPDRAASA
jgi:Arc/MetJ family transcription regulator